MKVVAFAGGVGGAKLAEGLDRSLPAGNLTVVVNTGDDFRHFGLEICPDLDTVCYTLAGLANAETGWGRADETWSALESVGRLGGPTWFTLGDRDLGTHLERTRRLQAGEPLSQVTRSFCEAWGIQAIVLPMTDQQVVTRVLTVDEGEIPFQEYFVKKKCQPIVRGFRFEGIEAARAAPGVLEAIQAADCIILCPSNPWVSIGPILALADILNSLAGKIVVAVSPIIGGKALKGPAAKIFRELGLVPSALTVAQHYGSLLTGFVMDQIDRDLAGIVDQSGIISYTTDTVMVKPADRVRLAGEVLQFCETLRRSRRMSA